MPLERCRCLLTVYGQMLSAASVKPRADCVPGVVMDGWVSSRHPPTHPSHTTHHTHTHTHTPPTPTPYPFSDRSLPVRHHISTGRDFVISCISVSQRCLVYVGAPACDACRGCAAVPHEGQPHCNARMSQDTLPSPLPIASLFKYYYR